MEEGLSVRFRLKTPILAYSNEFNYFNTLYKYLCKTYILNIKILLSALDFRLVVFLF
jgi:hypothetical protein